MKTGGKMNAHFIREPKMATNFKIEKGESKKHEAAEKHYVVDKDLAKEVRKVEKELKAHENLPMNKAHK